MVTKRPPLAIIAAARRHIALVSEWTTGLDVTAYEADARTRYACERAFIAIGEALGDPGGKVDLAALAPIPPLVWDTITYDLAELDAALAGLEAALLNRI